MESIRTKKSTIKWMMSFSLPAKRHIAFAIFLNVVFSALTVVSADIFRKFFDSAQSGKIDKLTQFVVVLVAIELFQTIIHFISAFVASKANRITIESMRRYILEDIFRIQQCEIDKASVGSLVSLVQNDVDVAANTCSATVIRGIHLIVRFCIYIGYLFSINPYLTALSALIGPAIFFVGRFYTPKIERINDSLRASDAIQAELVMGLIQKIALIKTTRSTSVFIKKYDDIWINRRNFIDKACVEQTSYDEITSFLGVSGNILTIAFGAVFYANGAFSIGAMVAYMQIVNQVVWPFVEMSNIWGNFVVGATSANRLLDLSELKHEGRMPLQIEKSESSEFAVYGHDICYSYDEKPVGAISGLDIAIQVGSTVGIHGPNGSGKSTLAKLISGLYVPQCGQLNVQQIFTDENTLEGVRTYVEYIMQSENIFNGSFTENISLGMDREEEEIIAAAKAVGLHEYIKSLPEGYKTEIVDGNLSGGQIQRIALARAMLSVKPIIVLDEITNNLDMVAHGILRDWIQTQHRKKTIILICHGQKLADLCDMLYVMDEGSIVQKGTHSELLNSEGIYKELYYQGESA